MPLANIFPLSLALSALAIQPLGGTTGWPLWNSYASVFLEDSGRIVDHDTADRTTSEGQAYALFFSLVGNDRPKFDRILLWTQTHLARGDIAANLPAWLWGNQQGTWKVIDNNSAADADLWIAYTLLEAGRLWGDPKLTTLGRALANSVMQLEASDISGLGPMLLPGPAGFRTSDGWVQLNASYLPVQLLLGIAGHTGSKRWRQIADLVPLVVEGSSAKGFILDWIAYRSFEGFSTQPSPVSPLLASYDAIRVYLWAGTLAPSTAGRERILAAAWGMSAYLDQNALPPARISESGQVTDARGNVGFSAAVIPMLVALKRTGPLQLQTLRLQSEKSAKTGLYGTPPHYYDQNLALFSLGWSEKRFSFDEHGQLGVNWK
jgi:endo-1,4-beta-D-glucanase Y